MLAKTNFIEISKKNKKPIVLFGSGNISKKTIRKLGLDKVEFIVDNSTNLQTTEYEGLQVRSPKELNKDFFVLICSTAIREISTQLEGLGFVPNLDFSISPILNDLLAIQELEELSETFYFTSGSVPDEGEYSGGGFYCCEIKGLEKSITKLHSGPCYGATKVGNDIYFIDTDKGIFSFSNTNRVEYKCELPKGSRAHGISYNPKKGNFYVTCSYLDAVLEVDGSSFSVNRRFALSNKINQSGEPMHHCNDNWCVENSLYVSMFSSTGNWKLDSFDGCIAEFDLSTGERLTDVYTGLYMPHNIMILDGMLHVLDSLPGHLRFSNFSIQGTFPAFTRGLAYKEGLYFIGQSKNRNYSKVMGMSNNVSIDCGVIIFNPILKASRFIQLPYTIGEIHSIVVK